MGIAPTLYRGYNSTGTYNTGAEKTPFSFKSGGRLKIYKKRIK